MTGNDADSTLLAMVPVDVEYFDLSAYDLQKYMITENGAPVEQPTVLHLMIQMLEKYYLSDGSKSGEQFRCNDSYRWIQSYVFPEILGTR